MLYVNRLAFKRDHPGIARFSEEPFWRSLRHNNRGSGRLLARASIISAYAIVHPGRQILWLFIAAGFLATARQVTWGRAGGAGFVSNTDLHINRGRVQVGK